MLPVLVHNTARKTLHEGCVEGKTILVKCSGCDKPLVYVWANQPEVDVDLSIIANCCYCDDKSFPLEIHGMFSAVGYEKEFDSPVSRPMVRIVNINFEDDGEDVLIETEKV